jgi:hypothetical protein
MTEGELQEEQWELIAPLLPNIKEGVDLGLTTGVPSMPSSGSCAPVLAGGTYHQSMAASPLATDDSNSGKTREFGNASS